MSVAVPSDESMVTDIFDRPASMFAEGVWKDLRIQ